MIFIVSTMNEAFDPHLSNISPNNCVVINQGKSSGKYFNYDYAGVIYDDGVGLSRSRNIGLEFCQKQRLRLPWIISDDDVVYLENFKEKLSSNNLKLAKGINVGRIMCPDGYDFKDYKNHHARINSLLETFSISSVEIIINDSELIRSVRFNEDFGLGSVNAFGGEEALFLRDWRALGGGIFRIAIYLGVHPRESTGAKVHEEGYWSTRKNLFKELSPKFWLFFYLAFKLKKKVHQLSNYRRHFT